MKRLLLIAIPWMAFASAALSQARFAEAILPGKSTPVSGYRLGDEFMAPVSALSDVGWHIDVKGSFATIHDPNGDVRVMVRSVNDSPCIALRKALDDMGATSNWLPLTDDLQVLSPLQVTSVGTSSLRFHSLLPVKVSATLLATPSQIVVDVSAAYVPTGKPLNAPRGSTVTQYRSNDVRISIPVPSGALIQSSLPITGSDVSLTWSLPQPSNPAPILQTSSTASTTSSTAGGPAGLVVKTVSDTPQEVQLQIGVAGQTIADAQVTQPDLDTVQITIPIVSAAGSDAQFDPTSLGIKYSNQVVSGNTVLTLHLSRPCGLEEYSDNGCIDVSLYIPVAGGSLQGKTVVVDPGHGGKDSGAKAAGVREKDITLRVGLVLAHDLAAAGAHVIMTRTTDVFIPLLTRSDIANTHHASLFISCHVNDSGNSDVMSGSIAFYHGSNPISRLLAQCIESQIALASREPNIGVWSDTRIYHSGFSVLRNTKVPAVLLEMGFINCPQDRKRLLEPSFPHDISAAIVRGVEEYLGQKRHQ